MPPRSIRGETLLGLGELLIAPRVVLGEPLGVRQQVADRDPRRVGGRIAQRLAAPARSARPDRRARACLVAQLEDRHRGEALGHRRNRKDGVGVDRRVGNDIPDARGTRVRELTVDDHAPCRARHMSGLDEVREQPIDVSERGLQSGPAVRNRNACGTPGVDDETTAMRLASRSGMRIRAHPIRVSQLPTSNSQKSLHDWAKVASECYRISPGCSTGSPSELVVGRWELTFTP